MPRNTFVSLIVKIEMYRIIKSVVKVLEFVNETTLISIGRDQVINVWDLKNYSLLTSFPVYDSIEGGGVISTPIANLIYTAGQKGELKLYLMKDNEFTLIQTINVCPDGVVDVIRTTQSSEYSVTIKIHLVTVDHNIHTFLLNQENQSFNSFGIRCGFNDELFDVKYINDNFIVATNSNLLKYYNSETLSCEIMTGHSDVVLCIDTFGDFCCSGSKDHTAILWKLIDGEFQNICTIKGHTASITAITMNDKFIFTCSDDRTMKKWIIPSNTTSPLSELECESTTLVHAKQITSIALSPNNKLVATCSHDKLIKLWNTTDCALVSTMKGHGRGVNGIQFSPVEMCLVSCGSDSLIKIWNVKDHSCIKVTISIISLILDFRRTFKQRCRNQIHQKWNRTIKLRQ